MAFSRMPSSIIAKTSIIDTWHGPKCSFSIILHMLIHYTPVICRKSYQKNVASFSGLVMFIVGLESQSKYDLCFH